MTDKQLDEKLINAFDNVRADGSVKARVRKGLTGDSMERKNITVTNNTENTTEKVGTEKREKVTVRRKGRVAAAAAAAVMLVGGGGYLLKSGFDNVDSPVATGESADQLTGRVPDDFVGWFDPEGYTVFDKFGPESDIWRLNDGRFLVMQYGNLNGEIDEEYYKGTDSMEYHYFIYDGSQNSVVGNELHSKDWRIQVYDDCFALWDLDFGENGFTGVYDAISCTGNIYDFDMNPIKSDISFTADEGEKIFYMPMVSSDKEVRFATTGIAEDGFTPLPITICNDDGTECIADGDDEYLCSINMSNDGGYIYYVGQRGFDPPDFYVNVLPRDGSYALMRTKMTGVENEIAPRVFGMGEKLYYFTTLNDCSQIELYKADISASETDDMITENDQPAAILDITDGSERYSGSYISESGRFLFVCGDDFSDSNSCIICVYDLENGYEKIAEERVPGLNLTFDEFGANILVDEASGDVNIGGFFDGKMTPAPRQKNNITFNLYGVEYGNFGIGVYSEPDEPESNDEITESISCNETIEPYYGFDPKANTIFGKFGSLADIWRITDDRYVVESLIEEGDSRQYEFVVYDVPSNTIVNRILTDRENGIAILDSGFVTYANPEKNGSSRTISATVYDLDGNEVLTYDLDTGSFTGGVPETVIGIRDVEFSHDGTAMYVAVEKKNGSDNFTTHIYRGTPNEFSVVYGMLNEEGWDNITIMDMAVSQDGNTLAYEYIDSNGTSMKAGLMDTGSYRIDEAQPVSYDEFADLGWDGHHYLFERGNDFYFINDETGKVVIAKAVNGGYTSELYVIPQQGSYDYYVSESGRYILLTSTDTDDSHIYIYEITDDGLTLVKDLNMGRGDLPLYYDGWNTYVSREGDYPPKDDTQGAFTTITTDIPDVEYGYADELSDEYYGYATNTDMTVTIEGDMIYILNDTDIIEEVKQWYKDFLAAGHEPAVFPDHIEALGYQPAEISFYDNNGDRVTIETPEYSYFDVRVNGVDYKDVGDMEIIWNVWWHTFDTVTD